MHDSELYFYKEGVRKMEKKNIDWANLGFGYMKTDKRFVSTFKDGAWDEGQLSEDDMITMSESAGVLQYAQTIFEGLKAYTTEDGRIVCFRPDLNAERMAQSAARLEMPVYPEDKFVEAVVETVEQMKHMYLHMVPAQLCMFGLICSGSIRLLE